MNEPEQIVMSFEPTRKSGYGSHQIQSDCVGRRFGRLVAERMSKQRRRRGLGTYDCACDCGKRIEVKGSWLTKGRAKSCGCLRHEIVAGLRLKHGRCDTRTYGIWQAMKTRCTNPNQVHYRRYGGRGITICDRWLNSYVNFLADMGEAPEGMSLERTDNSLGYSKENCIWAGPKQQQNNRCNNVLLTHDGRTMTVAAWCEATNLTRMAIMYRMHRGWTMDRVLTTPLRQRITRQTSLRSR